jgi:hypothetical protein
MSNLALVVAFLSTLSVFSPRAHAGATRDGSEAPDSAHPCEEEYFRTLHMREDEQEAFACWQREVLAPRAEGSTPYLGEFEDDLEEWAEARGPSPAFHPWALPSAGLSPLGAAPGLPGTTTIVFSAGAAGGTGAFFSSQERALTTMVSHVLSPRVSLVVGAGRYNGGDKLVAAGLLGRVIVTKPKSAARIAFVGGAGGGPVDRYSGGGSFFSPAFAVAGEWDRGMTRLDALIGYPLITEGGVSIFSRDQHHVVRLGWTTILPTFSYRYVNDRHFFGVEVASVVAVNAIWLRAGVRLGRR